MQLPISYTRRCSLFDWAFDSTYFSFSAAGKTLTSTVLCLSPSTHLIHCGSNSRSALVIYSGPCPERTASHPTNFPYSPKTNDVANSHFLHPGSTCSQVLHAYPSYISTMWGQKQCGHPPSMCSHGAVHFWHLLPLSSKVAM